MLTRDAESVEIEEEGILEYWKRCQPMWPGLAQMAQDVLAVPATSVGVERMFNMARDICHYRRGHLKPDTIRDLMLFKHFNRETLSTSPADPTNSDRDFDEASRDIQTVKLHEVEDSYGSTAETESEDDVYQLPVQAAPKVAAKEHGLRPSKRPHSQIL